jgi:hypothetical protein
MGDTIWVDVQGRAEDELPSDNSLMLRLQDQLARLSAKLGVVKLSDFYDYSELEDYYSEFKADGDGTSLKTGDEDEAPAAHQSKGSWFDPAEALRAVRAIRRHLIQHPGDLGFEPDETQGHWPPLLMEELEHCETVLGRAASDKRLFRFLIVP